VADAVVVEGLHKTFGDVAAVLSTVLPPDGGRAEVLGFDVASQADAVRRRIGLAGQFAAVDENLSGRENLKMIGVLAQLPSKAILPRADELLERFELSEAATRAVRTYSGGMRRRLDVAAALMRRPPVLFLDEPTTGLDIYSREELWKMINELVADGTTVLLTTQYLEEADRLAERVAVVDRGRVIANDTPQRLKAELGGTVIELGYDDAANAARARDEVTRVAGEAHVELEDTTIRVTTDDGAHLLMGVLRPLDTTDLAPARITVREPSLDDVFLSMTGHHAEDTATETPDPAAAAPGGRRRRGRR
jgi:ABC-2 type transport system ATP-binding protein